MNEVKAKLDIIHQLLDKQASFTKDVQDVDVHNNRGDEEDVNFISGTSFRNHRSRNQGGNMNFCGNGQMSNNNQSSQYQKPYINNYNNNNNNYRTFGSSSYQNLTPATQESKI